LDGCCDHREISADEETHRHATEILEQVDALLFGRVTYEMMESAWRPPGQMEAMPDWMVPFSRTRNAEIVRGDVGEAVQELGLIDEYEFVVQPRLVGHGPTLFAGLSKRVDLRLVRAGRSSLQGRWRCGTSLGLPRGATR
jgi:dihydrofolate reductase